MKRTRGRRRHPNGGNGSSSSGNNGGNQYGNNPNRSFDSNGPDVKVRGAAAHIFEKYQQLARDATSSGDRILAENYLQHAEHYYRLVKTMQPTRVINDINDEDGEGQNREDQNQNQGQHNQGQHNQGQQNHQHVHATPQPHVTYDQPSSSGMDVVNLQAVPGVAQPMIIEDAQPDALPAFLQKPVFNRAPKPEAAADAGAEAPKARRAPYPRVRRPKFDAATADAQAAEVSGPSAGE